MLFLQTGGGSSFFFFGGMMIAAPVVLWIIVHQDQHGIAAKLKLLCIS
jgi:hypothetical protein